MCECVLHHYVLLFCRHAEPSFCVQAFFRPAQLRQKVLEEIINYYVRAASDQRLFPDITFTCNGIITKWIIGAKSIEFNNEQPTELQIRKCQFIT